MSGGATAGAEVANQVASITGRDVLRLEPLTAAGSYVPNRHYRATLAGGSTVFVKEATGDWTLEMLRTEKTAYGELGDRPYLPKYLGGDENILVVEDLGSGHWPPPWRKGDLGHVMTTLAEIASASAPYALRDLNSDGLLHCWRHVADSPDSFLSLGLCTATWFDGAVGALVATDATPLGGATLVHGDFRGDNACIVGGRVVVVDWAAAARGRGDFDRTGFALSHAVETGEPPERVAPGADPDLVGVLAGPLARFAGDVSVPMRVRAQLTNQLRIALPWWSRLVGIPAS